MRFDNNSIDNFRKDFDEAVKNLEVKYGVKIELGHITYDYCSFTSKLKVQDNSLGDEAAFRRYCSGYGLQPDDYKRVVVLDGKEYEILGFDLNGKKYPIKTRKLSNDKIVYWTQDYVANALRDQR